MKHLRASIFAILLLAVTPGCGNVLNGRTQYQNQGGGSLICTMEYRYPIGVIVDLPAGVSPNGLKFVTAKGADSSTAQFDMSLATHFQNPGYDYWQIIGPSVLQYDVNEHNVSASLPGSVGTWSVTVTHPSLATVVRQVAVSSDGCQSYSDIVSIQMN